MGAASTDPAGKAPPPARGFRSLAVLPASFGSGLLLSLATPPWDLVPMSWLALGILYLLLAEETPPPSRFRRATAGALRGLLFGAATNLVALRFTVPVVSRYTPLPYWVGIVALAALSLEQGLRFAVACAATIQLARRGVPRWLAFAAGVYWSTFLPCVFPWTVAIGAVPVPAFLQLAEFMGERGVAFLMALAAGLGAEGVLLLRAGRPRRRALALLGAAAAIPALTYVHGVVAIRRLEAERAEARSARVALLQPSIEATERWDPAEAESVLARLGRLTREAEGASPPPDLTVWTEGAYPYLVDARSRADVPGRRAIEQEGVRGPLLVGLMMRKGNAAYNSAVMVTGGHLSEPYSKMHLLVFGEYVPFGDTFPWLEEVFYRGTGLLRGAHQVALEAGPIRAIALICYEDTLSYAVRDALRVRPNLLVNVTNDAWYTGSMESELHLRLATPRSIEARRDMVRAVNLGQTTWVDAAGRVRGRYASEAPGLLRAEPALLERETLYARAGDAPLVVIAILATLAFAVRRSGPAARGAAAAPGSAADRLG